MSREAMKRAFVAGWYMSNPVDKMNEEFAKWYERQIEATQSTHCVGNAELDQGMPNHYDPNKRGFSPK